jgi:hypothetical protein
VGIAAGAILLLLSLAYEHGRVTPVVLSGSREEEPE